MPFLGKDWRSGGEQWIKTDQGWERVKVLETILEHINMELKKDKTMRDTLRHKQGDTKLNNNSICEDDDDDDDDEYDCDNDENNEDGTARLRRLSINSDDSNKSVNSKNQPCIYIHHQRGNILNRQSNVPKLTVTEILSGLDMVGAVKDVRRFNYVCKLVQLIINEKLRQISGNAQRSLFLIVRVMLEHVLETKENLHLMKKLLTNFKSHLNQSYHYFYYIGTQKLWDRHLHTINKWLQMLDNEIHANINESKMCSNTTDSFSLVNLPNDCKLEILRRFNTGLDLVNLSKCNKSFYDIISNEITVWKSLCSFHFQQSNINTVLMNKNQNEKVSISEQNLDWKSLYFRLKRRYGHREIYADMIHKCLYCKCLYWKEIGHPCLYNDTDDENGFLIASEPITPNKLLHLLMI